MDDLLAHLDQWLDRIRFAQQIEEDSARTILCPPGREHAIRAALDQLGVRHDLHKVVASPIAVDHIYVVDEQAIEAEWQEWMQRRWP